MLEPEGYSSEARALLEQNCAVLEGPMDRRTLLKRIHAFEILVVRLGHQIDAEVLEAAKKLRVIVSPTTGLNHIDLGSANKRGIAVLSLQGHSEFLNDIHATAEHTWALLLALVRKVPQAHAHAIAGGWERDIFKGHELHGKTLGIVGLGRLGKKVARFGCAFGMRVLGCDIRTVAGLPSGIEQVEWDDVIANADVVTLHANFTEANRGILNSAAFARMKTGSVFINTARGELVDEKALLYALEHGPLVGAALDVLCGEHAGWNMSAALLEYARRNDRLLLTPHLGGCTVESMEKTEYYMVRQLLNHLSKGA